jgi:hypothetical protein
MDFAGVTFDDGEWVPEGFSDIEVFNMPMDGEMP